jgi:phage gp29-like protein
MEALSVAYMFKQLSLKDWVSYSEKFGTPGLLAKTTAAKDSAEWQVVVEAVEAFGQDWSAVVNEGSSIELIEAKGAGSLPFPSLVERMDRAIATICRGADLSTLSAGSGAGQGASLQGDEGDLMEQDDAELITETLQRIDRIIIAQLYGEEPLAYVQIQVPKRPDNADTRANLTLLRDSGVPISAQWARDQFGVPAPIAGEATLTAPAPAAAPGAFPFANAAAAGKAALFRTEALRSLKAAQVKALQPLIARIVAVADLPDARFDAGLATLKADLPALAKEILSSDASGELARAFESILGTALVSGAATAAEKQAAAK